LYPLARKVYTGLTYRWAQFRFRKAAAGLPIPPADLNFLATGSKHVGSYVESGWLCFTSIIRALERAGVSSDKLKTVLDFGCGCGRVIRYWNRLPARVHGTDQNPRLIEWCRAKLGFAQFQTNRFRPPLTYRDGTFDLVYALSVFTHMDGAHQQAWIAELTRILKPGGHLLLTTQGACTFYLDQLGARERAQLLGGALVLVKRGALASDLYGTFQSERQVRDHLLRGLAVVDHVPSGALGNPYQDLYLARKPGRRSKVLAAAA
jgi:SAM-dependent methyltransferase